VPEGARLAVTAISSEELQIDLVEAPEGAPRAASPVSVPARVARYHPVVRQFKAQADRHEVSRQVLPRVLWILQGLVVESERRGHHVEIAGSGRADGYGRQAWSAGNTGISSSLSPLLGRCQGH
jgi:hypothetical protein